MSTMPSPQPSDGAFGQPRLLQNPLEKSADTLKTAEPMHGEPRLRHAIRNQLEFRTLALDQLLPDEHTARIVWQYVEGIDLEPLLSAVLAVAGRPGRDTTDPRILLALWLYATLDGVGSARELDRLCRDHVAYQWIAGGVSLNYHTLSDFRGDHGEFLDQLLTRSVATLVHEDLVELKRVAQDGMRVRASAGASSFRRRGTLEECLKEAQEQVETLRREIEADPAATTRRQQAARQRAARERSERVTEAIRQCDELDPQRAAAAKRAGREPTESRASTTDPDARRMKMADGGFRPAYNAQFATATDSQVIVGVELTNSGNDGGQMLPMVEQIETRYGQAPNEMLVDGGFATHEDIEAVSAPERGTVVYAPMKEEKRKRAEGKDPFAPQRGDSVAVASWRQRMGTEEAKQIYRERGATAECVNALARNRGLYSVRVRGLAKVRTVLLWYALAHNLMRAASLRAAAVRAVSLRAAAVEKSA
jgi:transposase